MSVARICAAARDARALRLVLLLSPDLDVPGQTPETVTEKTIQDHLKSIFAKTSSRSRRALLSRALGTWARR